MYVHNYKMIAIYLARIPRVLKRKKSKETHSQNSLTDIEQLTLQLLKHMPQLILP